MYINTYLHHYIFTCFVTYTWIHICAFMQIYIYIHVFSPTYILAYIFSCIQTFLLKVAPRTERLPCKSWGCRCAWLELVGWYLALINLSLCLQIGCSLSKFAFDTLWLLAAWIREEISRRTSNISFPRVRPSSRSGGTATAYSGPSPTNSARVRKPMPLGEITQIWK